MYSIIFDEEAIEFLEKLEKNVARRIYNKIIETEEIPHRFFERLAGRMDYKLRIGDYRAIAEIDNEKKIIQITLIGHRKNVYKKK